MATVQLEFKYLSYLTGDEKYWKAAENVVLKINELDSLDGLVPIYIKLTQERFALDREVTATMVSCVHIHWRRREKNTRYCTFSGWPIVE